MSQGLVGRGDQEMPMGLSREPLRVRLNREKAGIERRLADIDKALSLLERNPDIEELMNLV